MESNNELKQERQIKASKRAPSFHRRFSLLHFGSNLYASPHKARFPLLLCWNRWHGHCLNVSGSVAPIAPLRFDHFALVLPTCYQSALTRTELNRHFHYPGFCSAALQPFLCLHAASITRRHLVQIRRQRNDKIKAQKIQSQMKNKDS